MANIFKLNCYLVDPDGDCTTDDIEQLLEYFNYAFPKHIEIDGRDIGEWDDNNPLNYIDSPKSECEKYFKKDDEKTKHSHWIDTDDTDLDLLYSGWQCSECGYINYESKVGD